VNARLPERRISIKLDYEDRKLASKIKDWRRKCDGSLSRLVRQLLRIIHWDRKGVIYSLCIPPGEHQSAERLRAALTAAVDRIMREFENKNPPGDNASPGGSSIDESTSSSA
jgi:hypothetical protein